MAFEALISSFLTSLGEAGSRVVDADPRLAARLGGLVADGQRAWPSLAVPPKDVVAYVAARIPTERVDVMAALQEMQVLDLFLACACVTGVDGADETLTAHVRAVVEGCAVRIDPGREFADEVEAALLADLLTRDGEPAVARLARYDGRDPLVAWVRVATERAALRVVRQRGRQPPAHERAVAAQLALGESSELAYLRRYYETDFEDAFTSASASLTDRERALLRLHLGGDVSLTVLARMYGVREAIVGQWIDDARQALIAETEAHLKRRLRVSPAEFDSVARVLPTQLEARITQLALARSSPPAGGSEFLDQARGGGAGWGGRR